MITRERVNSDFLHAKLVSGGLASQGHLPRFMNNVIGCALLATGGVRPIP